ncbi:methyl-CpG binding domain-containing protein 4 [Colletotrichum orchidophilum]|uniref:Methyl-CpG binding domain-containing protein 4 n=1 Tax=Colletotrichum orchidophilum TaxID=1209926 RepID=A0A1G4B6L2_9PEZI|nr:methyl-CpG binding domain-containing protein 4 [Colletotrichum orchidophilum]OHE96925.1 methyl-CpG binding domain-containing protein 4 [Colletotrichum orchidophilum]
MAHTLADDVFVGFDVPEVDKPFLLDVLAAPGTPWDEKLAVYDLGLFSGYEDWNLMLESAASIKEQSPISSPLDARDLLAFVPRVKDATLAADKLRQGWAATDQSIKKLATLLRVHRSGIAVEPQPAAIKRERILKREGVTKRGREDEEENDDEDAQPNNQRVKRRRIAPKPSTSHYFAPPAGEQSPRNRPEQPAPSPFAADAARAYTPAVIRNGIATPNVTPRKQSLEKEAPNDTTVQTPAEPTPSSSKAQNATYSQGSSGRNANLANPVQQSVSDELVRIIVLRGFEPDQVRGLNLSGPSPRRKTAVKSPFFSLPSPAKQSPRSKRGAGLVSTIPFPRLSAPKFGLIQEEFAHEPFWLLVVVTFLVKTAGTLAIPTFYKVKERFPTPAALADPRATPIIMNMIHHLGLSVVRTAAIQRYARVWLEKPPAGGVVYRVKKYDKRDIEASTLRPDNSTDQGSSETPTTGDADDAWEMGHFTQGKYALDSWRIFCRDELLGRAQDWNGKGAAPNFQPEWMRVRPDDKELRACLRWMWMREGWEWDPVTGERTVLRDEMQRAVNEERVEYDDTGGLRMLDEPRSVSS